MKKNGPSKGLVAARLASRERIQAGMGDKEAAERYRILASKSTEESRWEDYLQRAAECDRLSKEKLTGRT